MPSTELSHYPTPHYSDKDKYQWRLAFLGTRARAAVTENRVPTKNYDRTRKEAPGKKRFIHKISHTWIKRILASA